MVAALSRRRSPSCGGAIETLDMRIVDDRLSDFPAGSPWRVRRSALSLRALASSAPSRTQQAGTADWESARPRCDRRAVNGHRSRSLRGLMEERRPDTAFLAAARAASVYGCAIRSAVATADTCCCGCAARIHPGVARFAARSIVACGGMMALANGRAGPPGRIRGWC